MHLSYFLALLAALLSACAALRCPGTDSETKDCLWKGSEIRRKVPKSTIKDLDELARMKAEAHITCCVHAFEVDCLIARVIPSCNQTNHNNITANDQAEELLSIIRRNVTTSTEQLNCTGYEFVNGSTSPQCVGLISRLNVDASMPSDWLIVGCILGFTAVVGVLEILGFIYYLRRGNKPKRTAKPKSAAKTEAPKAASPPVLAQPKPENNKVT